MEQLLLHLFGDFIVQNEYVAFIMKCDLTESGYETCHY